jgi:hypothetical protein
MGVSHTNVCETRQTERRILGVSLSKPSFRIEFKGKRHAKPLLRGVIRRVSCLSVRFFRTNRVVTPTRALFVLNQEMFCSEPGHRTARWPMSDPPLSSIRARDKTCAFADLHAIISIIARSAYCCRHQAIAAQLHDRGAVIVSTAAFVGAFVVSEGGLFVIAAGILGGAEDFAPAIVTRILEINAAAFGGLLVLNQVAVAVGSPRSMAGRHA